MKRRTFLKSAVATTGTLLLTTNPVLAKPADPQVCVPTGLDFVSAEATYHARYQHFHLLSIPVSVLVEAPAAGYKVRTTTLDQGSLDEEAFIRFIKETGLNEQGLRFHSHEVNFAKEELIRIGSGEKEVEITVMTPGGNLAHRFYFTASPATVIKIKRARG